VSGYRVWVTRQAPPGADEHCSEVTLRDAPHQTVTTARAMLTQDVLNVTHDAHLAEEAGQTFDFAVTYAFPWTQGFQIEHRTDAGTWRVQVHPVPTDLTN